MEALRVWLWGTRTAFQHGGNLVMHFEARFSAVGGQGIILAGTIVADAAHLMGLHAAGSPTYTAQVRGGPTKVEVIVDSDQILYPRTENIDFFLSLATRSYERYNQDLRDGCPVLIDPNLVKVPDEDYERFNIYEVPIVEMTTKELGRMVYASAVALGTMVALTDVFDEEVIRVALKNRAPKGTEVQNMKALQLGIDYTKDLLAKA